KFPGFSSETPLFPTRHFCCKPSTTSVYACITWQNSHNFLLSAFLFGCQHGAAAIRGTTAAFIVFLDLLGVAFIQHQTIVVIQFFAFAYIAQGMDVNAPLFFAGFTVGIASMIDPAGIIAIYTTIDDLAAFQAEEKSMERIFRVRSHTLAGFLFTDTFTFIFDDEGICRDFAGGKYATSMYGRIAHDIKRLVGTF